MQLTNIKTDPETPVEGEPLKLLSFDVYEDGKLAFRVGLNTEQMLCIQLSHHYRIKGTKNTSPEIDVDEAYVVVPDRSYLAVQELHKRLKDSLEYAQALHESLGEVLGGIK
jgi:hypothetical protein